MSKRKTSPRRRVRRRLRSVVGLPGFEKTMRAIDRFERRSRKAKIMVKANAALTGAESVPSNGVVGTPNQKGGV